MPSAKTGPDRKDALEAHGEMWVFLSSGFDRLSHYFMSALPNFVGRALLSGDRFSITLTAGHNRPRHARGLVCQRHSGDLRRSPRQQFDEPWPARAVALRKPDHSEGAYNEQLPEVAIPLLGDAAQSFFPAARVLSRHQTNPRGKISARPKRLGIRDRSHERTRQDRSDAWYAHQESANFTTTRAGNDAAIGV